LKGTHHGHCLISAGKRRIGPDHFASDKNRATSLGSNNSRRQILMGLSLPLRIQLLTVCVLTQSAFATASSVSN
jgi:hypothetical protein